MKLKNSSEIILKNIKSKGFKLIELDSVIETNHIVERSGENFRRFIFSFKDQNGNELCLRPDLTIASCIKYLNEKNTKVEKVVYSGQAFRKTLNQKEIQKDLKRFSSLSSLEMEYYLIWGYPYLFEFNNHHVSISDISKEILFDNSIKSLNYSNISLMKQDISNGKFISICKSD